MAGGIDLVNAMKRGSNVAHVVYLRNIPQLHGIHVTHDFMTIGAATTHATIERADLPHWLQPLREIVQEIGNVRVREVGTVGGNMMAANRNYDWLPLLMALGAEMAFADSPNRWRPVDSLTNGCGEWRIPARLLRAVRIPLTGVSAFTFNRDLKPVISVAACWRRWAAAETLRVSIGCAFRAPIVRELDVLEERGAIVPRVGERGVANHLSTLPRNDALAAALGRSAVNMFPSPHDDGLSSSDYRRQMMRTLVERAVLELCSKA